MQYLYGDLSKENAKKIVKIYANAKVDGASFLIAALEQNNFELIAIAINHIKDQIKFFNIIGTDSSSKRRLRARLNELCNSNRYTSLMLAAQYCHVDVVKTLLEFGISVYGG